jgi:hypothetical protein
MNIAPHQFISPGPLSARHQAIPNCSDCHVAGQDISLAALLTTDTQIADSRQCLRCHARQSGLTPHGVPLSELKAITDRMKASTISAPSTPLLAPISINANREEIACVNCHLEHRGAFVQITRLPDQSCQVCHVQAFESFTSEHPEFTDFPSAQPGQRPFNHITHEKDYFPLKAVSFTCANCHTVAPDRRRMLTEKFEKSCSGCHQEQIRRSGMPVFRLPGVDFDTLVDHEIDIGEWPADANLDLEEDITPFMKLLLFTDARIARDLRTLDRADRHLYDLEGADETQIAAAGRVIWAVKGLYYDLIDSGQSELIRRLNNVLDKPLDHRETLALTGQEPHTPSWLLPVMTPQWLNQLQSAQQRWLPGLKTEVPQYREGQATALKELSIKYRDPGESERENPRGGWYGVDRSFAIFYRPTEHEDPFMRSWIDMSGEGSLPEARDIFDRLTARTAETPGQCMKCHTVSDTAGQPARQVAWSAILLPPRMQTNTLFAHANHVEIKDCRFCHAADAKKDFKLLAKSACTECHNGQKAGETCLTCHKYHLGTLTMTSGQTTPPVPNPSTFR